MSSSNRIARLTEWWRPKAGTILSLLLFYLALWGVPFETGWKLLAFSVWTLSGFGLIGYLLNDWADIPDDEKVGKTNLVKGIPFALRLIVLVGLAVFTAAPWVSYFKVDSFSLVLIGVQLFLQFAYPIPPLRLKRFPIVAVISDACYAFTVPALLAWHTFDLTTAENGNPDQIIHYLFLAIWMLSMGLRHIIAHHVVDRENDRLTQTPNLALLSRPTRLRQVIQRVLATIELVSAMLFFLMLFRESGMLPLVFLTVLIFIGSSMVLEHGFGFRVGFWKSELDRFTSFYSGLVSVLFLMIENTAYWMVLAVFLLLFTDIWKHPIIPVWIRAIVKRLTFYSLYPIRLASLVFNWSLYYFRKWVLGWSEERNWGEHYEKHLNDLEVEARKKKGVVAVFNQNASKYTETFIRGHLGQLPYQVISYFGWPSPVQTGGGDWLTGNDTYVREAKNSWFQLTNRNTVNEDDRLIAERLVSENVGLILAEFGTMGARLVNISRMTGMPLVTIFYGYDAWHKKVLQDFAVEYKHLFVQSEAVIGVSQDICEQLKRLGCNETKLHYLPCFVDLNLFSPIEKLSNDKTVLAVGRLCVTKAPELTILAFNEVLKSHPTAKLRIVGDDEGNGVMEHCVSLIRALRIEEKVRFLGMLSSSEVRTEMERANVFTQHSLTAPITNDKEGTPVAIMEAMASGLPVVSTKHAGIAEVIDSGKDGVLVEEFDYLRQAQEISELLSDHTKASAMGRAAAESIRNNHLVSNHIKELTEILDKHLN